MTKIALYIDDQCGFFSRGAVGGFNTEGTGYSSFLCDTHAVVRFLSVVEAKARRFRMLSVLSLPRLIANTPRKMQYSLCGMIARTDTQIFSAESGTATVCSCLLSGRKIQSRGLAIVNHLRGRRKAALLEATLQNRCKQVTVSSFLLLVERPGAPSSFLLLVAMPLLHHIEWRHDANEIHFRQESGGAGVIAQQSGLRNELLAFLSYTSLNIGLTGQWRKSVCECMRHQN